ncbi:MAG: hypothetical protein AAF713_07515 [Pseudomonadota bacterium]
MPGQSAAIKDDGWERRAALDRALLAAHADADGLTLAALYADASDLSEAAGDIDAAAFYMTHAYVFALETGHPMADAFHARLLALGREE